MKFRTGRIGLAALLCVAILGLAESAGARRGSIVVVLKSGDTLGTSVVSTVQAPFTDGGGRVGFLGSLADNQRFIWWDSGPVFFSGDALPLVLTGGESTMGVSDTGGFIYSPSVDGDDAVFTHGGPLLVEGDAFPPNPALFVTFNSRPQMLPDGTAHWVCGTAETQGGSSTNRHLLRASDPTDPGTITRVLGGGDVIEGKTIRTTSSNFDYWFSENGLHHIHALDMNVTANEHVYLDGGFVAQEGNPTGQGDNWSTFDIVGVNDSGNYIFTGDTDGVTTSDEFIAWNASIVVREGSTLDGVTLPSGSALRAAAINNNDEVAHIWGTSSVEHLFWGLGPQLGLSLRILSLGDSLDATGDGVPDWILTDFNASTTTGPGLDLHENGWIYIHVDITPVGGGAAVEAVIGVLTPPAMAVEDFPEGSERLMTVLSNPFSSDARVRIALTQESRLRLEVFDMSGRLLRRLADHIAQPGIREWAWDGRDASGRRVPAGTYFIRLQDGKTVETTKLVRVE